MFTASSWRGFRAVGIIACLIGAAGGMHVVTAAATSNTNINVTTVIYDAGIDGIALHTKSDHYNAIGQATYTTVSGNGPNNQISSWLQSSGGWVLNLFNQSLRTVYVTPNDPIDATQPVGPPPGYYWQNMEVYSVCYDQSNNKLPFPNLVNGSGNCSLGIDFNYGGTKYKLVMSPVLPAKGPATGLAQVVCGLVSNGQCASWTIQPNTAAPNATVANLYYYGTHGLTFVGQYHNTFRIGVSR